jgi:hypothetical protein
VNAGAVFLAQENTIVVHLRLPAEGSDCRSSLRSELTFRETVGLDEFLSGFTIESPPDDALRVRLTVTPS